MVEYSSHKAEDNTETIEETMVEITETEGYQRKTGINRYTMITTAKRVNQSTMALNQWINNHMNNMNPSQHTEEKTYKSHQPYPQLLIKVKTEALHKEAHPSNLRTEAMHKEAHPSNPRTEGKTEALHKEAHPSNPRTEEIMPLEQPIQVHKVHEMNR